MADWFGYDGHRIKMENLSVDKVRKLASKGWLPDSKYLDILLNQERYMELSTDLMPQNPIRTIGTEGSIFLCLKAIEDPFPYTIKEEHDVKIGNRTDTYMVCTRSYEPDYESREYALRTNVSTYKLVHYGVPDKDAKSRVDARLEVRKVANRLNEFGFASENRKGAILAALNSSGAGSSTAAIAAAEAAAAAAADDDYEDLELDDDEE